ncbi:hypothetical protein NP233_g10602 [Leucocoprinus birnbaumii]|uniref:Ankyrin repeat protein n=1 Tax=Leucocoprinus birnbaumii TaxID=56174 RepID=A0AAD5YRQ2_9AGAR|nr:hypothetical protein NP233_g10602 [Leucocoprinus birnbaumii]
MGIYEDARQGTLDRSKLNSYLQSNPNILNEQDPATGLAPLATAAVAGYADVVELLLGKGAKADALSKNGETALLVTTRDSKSKNRPRIVQLLLSKTPADSVDATSAADGNTPLMHAILRSDIESIRLLVKAKASLTVTNNNGLTAEKMAEAAPDKAVARALDPDKERSALTKLTSLVSSFLLYIVAWVNKTADGVMRKVFGLNPDFNTNTDDKVNDGETPNKKQFLENVDTFVKDSPLERFFKDKPNYIQDLAKKATELKNDPNTPLGQPDLLPKVIKVTLHQQVIYCDDSSSMKREGRWEAQVEMVKRIAGITTRILPEGDGVALRFINQDVPNNSDKLSLKEIGDIIGKMSWQPGGNTEIGTYLKSKILEPMVYSKLPSKTLSKPLLISVITDGMPSVEKDEAFVEAIKECGDKLDQAGPSDSCTRDLIDVKFMIGQIGTSKSAAEFLQDVGNNKDIESMVYVTTDQLDERLSKFKEKEGDLDRWLIETLFQPIKDD